MKSQKYTRREMLVNSVRIIAGLSLFTGCKGDSNKAVTRSGGFKIGACDWTIKKQADPSALELAKKIGLDGVQVSLGTIEDDMHLRQKSVQQQYLEMAKKHEVEIASLAIGELNNVPYKGDDPRALEWVNDSIDVSRALGVNVVLVPFFGKADLRDDKAGTEVVIKRLKQVVPKAEKAGVLLGIESWLSAEEHLNIIERVGSPAIKVYYDVGNSHKQGYDIYQEIQFLGKNICEFHAKDYDDLYGKGSIDFEKIRQSIDKIGYRGWIIMEGTKMPLGLEESCRYDLEYLRGVFPPAKI